MHFSSTASLACASARCVRNAQKASIVVISGAVISGRLERKTSRRMPRAVLRSMTPVRSLSGVRLRSSDLPHVLFSRSWRSSSFSPTSSVARNSDRILSSQSTPTPSGHLVVMDVVIMAVTRWLHRIGRCTARRSLAPWAAVWRRRCEGGVDGVPTPCLTRCSPCYGASS